MILIPAAGRGERFRAAGYTQAKHLLPLAGRPMVEWVIANVSRLEPGPVQVLTAAQVGHTRGTAETLARADCDPEASVLVANCDQLLAFPPGIQLQGDGVVFWFRSCSPAHSYLLSSRYGRIIGIVEKRVVSAQAVSGVYWFRQAGPLLEACREVSAGEGELYLSRALALLLERGADLRAVEAPTAILGTPEDYQRFEVAFSLAKSVGALELAAAV